MPQLTQQQIQQALDRGVSKEHIIEYALNGKVSQPNILEKTANVINKGYDIFKNLPVIKQVSQLVGGAIGTVGAIEGSIIGGGGQIIKNAVTNKPLFEDVGKSAIDIGKETASFGYELGKEGTPAAALGGAGRLINLAVAYSQGYQGVKDVIGAVKEGDVVKGTQGAIELGTALMGARGSVKSEGWLVNPEVAADIKQLPSALREKAATKIFENTVDSYKEILNQTPKEFQTELKYGKNTPEFLAKQGIILKAENGKLNTTEAVDTLKSRIDELDTKLEESLSQSNMKYDLYLLGEKAKRSIDANKNILSKDKVDAKATIDDYIQAEVNANGRKVDAPTLNSIKRNLWSDSFSMDKTRVTNDTLFQLGHELKNTIQDSIHDEPIQAMNKELGDFTTAIRFLTKANGRAIKGGRLTKLIYKGIGAIAGASTGSPLGAIAGAEIAGKASDIINSPSLKTGIRQKALEIVKPKQ